MAFLFGLWIGGIVGYVVAILMVASRNREQQAHLSQGQRDPR